MNSTCHSSHQEIKAFSYVMAVIIAVPITVLMIEDAWWVRYVLQFLVAACFA
jgi:ABC-type proline/glycine betaine transport system permease subunit